MILIALRRWFDLALKNPRTTAAGAALAVTGVKMLWSGDILHGGASLLSGLGLFLGADAVTVSRNTDSIKENTSDIADNADPQ